MQPNDLNILIKECNALVRQVGSVLMDFWRRSAELLITHKPDGSPSTAADLAAHHLLIESLQKITPGCPILSEEGQWPDYQERSQWTHYWLLDPLDGTRGFIAHLDQFSINLALIAEREPVLGIIYVPVTETSYYACQGTGAFKQVGQELPIPIHSLPKLEKNPWRVVLGQYSRGKRIAELINNRWPYQLLHVNSAIKFGWLAEGQADIYPRLGTISEWDTAAGQCILTEAGGAVVDLRGQTLQYNQQVSLLTPEFVAVADIASIDPWLQVLKSSE